MLRCEFLSPPLRCGFHGRVVEGRGWDYWRRFAKEGGKWPRRVRWGFGLCSATVMGFVLFWLSRTVVEKRGLRCIGAI